MRAVLACLSLAACVDQPRALEPVDTTPARQRELVGVDGDGAGGLWLAYRTPTLDYYEPTDVYLVHEDATGAELHEIHLRDTYTHVGGIAVGGGALWVNYSGSGSGDNRIRKLDPITGEELASFATAGGIADLAWRDGALVASYLWNQVIAIEPARGGELWRAVTPFEEGGTQRGIASDDAGMWVLEQWTYHVHVVDNAGDIQRSYRVGDPLDTFSEYTDQIAKFGDTIVIAQRDHLARFRVPQ